MDNIRRKAPAPRKPQVADDFTTNHHISVISEQLAATQQQVQQLQELYTEVSQTNKVLINEVVNLQKILSAQKQASHEIVNYLTPYDGQNNMMNHQQIQANGQNTDNDEAGPELRRARELLSSVNTDTLADRELERLQNVYGSPADSSAMVTPTSLPLMNDPMHDISRYPVYPVGQTVGIDPFHSDHIHKIPYAVPNDANANNAMPDHQQTLQQPPQPQPVSHPSGGSGVPNTAAGAAAADRGNTLWGPQKPCVLLVEDDPTCTKIGVKFLKSMGCEVEHAVSNFERRSFIRFDIMTDPYFTAQRS